MKLLSSLCFFVLTLTSFSTMAQAPAMGGGDGDSLNAYVAAWSSDNLDAVASTLTQMGYSNLARFVIEKKGSDVKATAAALAYRIFAEQQTVRGDRREFVLLQDLMEEALMKAEVPKAIFTGSARLTPAELLKAARVRGIEMIPGDQIVQIGASALSSHFIAGSQSFPGLASHSLLLSSGGDKPKILEALIEDGTNTRDVYDGQLARFWVLSAKTPEQRAQVASATQKFITDMKIPYVAPGEPSDKSPLFYDSTMDPRRKKDGFFFCTAVVQEVYLRSGISPNPYPENQSNWNSLLPGTIEAGLYRELNITSEKVPAPGDALLNSDMEIRALVLDTEGLKKSRRLRAVINAFFDILHGSPETRQELLSVFHQIPAQEVNKKQILTAFDKFAADPESAKALGAVGIKSVKDARAQMEKQLPQAANLRQIAFFILMNAVIQDKALKGLEAFETVTLKRHATPGELRGAATQMLSGEISKLRAGLAQMAKSSR